MTTQELISRVYSAFNRRDVDGVFALMSDDVSWPKASEGGRVVGKHAIREYWTRQWAEFDPHVDPLEVVDREDGTIEVRVRQLVKTLQGNILSDTPVTHVYSVADGLILRMDISDQDGPVDGPSAAFTG
jgi:ketosteroid isomerase-like protein